jgi:hypothetical protein
MDIITIAAKAITMVWLNLDRAFFNLFQDAGIRENHEYFEF